jgi:hypothetical protein
MIIINDDSRVINKLEASLIDNARVIIYDRHMFIVQATVLISRTLVRSCSRRLCEYALLTIFFATVTDSTIFT